MMNNVNSFVFAIAFLLLLGASQAQEAIPAAGGNSVGDGGSLNFTVGQVLYCSNTGSGGSVSEGVQQPYEIWVYSGIDEKESVELECSVYPNPVTNELTLKIESLNNIRLSYQLFDANGKLLENNNIETLETSISAKHLQSGTYFLKINSSLETIKVFKIIKQ
ncbi:MAG TPA: T9SS type A sorting domain-containing protein [Bacteroidales bacterium]